MGVPAKLPRPVMSGMFGMARVGARMSPKQPRHVKIVHAGGVAAGDPRIGVRGRLGLLVVRHSGQDLRQDFPRLGKRRFAVRIVRAPHHVVDTDGSRRRMPMASSWKLKTTLRRKKSLGSMPSPAFARAGP